MADNNNALNNMQAQTAQLQTNVAQRNSALIALEKLQGDMEDIITTNTKNVKDYTTQISSASDALKTLNDQASKISQTLVGVITTVLFFNIIKQMYSCMGIRRKINLKHPSAEYYFGS